MLKESDGKLYLIFTTGEQPASHNSRSTIAYHEIWMINRVPTLPGKPWKPGILSLCFSRPGKCLEFAQKVVKTWNFNSKPGTNLKFANSMFQASLFKISFTKIILIYFFVISTLSTQTLIRSQIDLGFHCFYLEITWRIHGILCHKRSWNPASLLTHFEFFITNICTWNLAQQTLKKAGI